MSNHPKHPALVHFPITFTFLTGALDTAYILSTHPSTSKAMVSLLNYADIAIQPTAFPMLSYYTTILTILFSVPAVISGALEFMPVIKRDGISSKKAQAGVLHALVNDITVLGAVFNWWTRRNTANFVPDSTNVLVSSVLGVPATFFAAYLGGQLVYQYGMGVGRGRSTAGKKLQ
ncbi:hypothetical protein P154DRAFT_463523 [Amniculicola lignicola CBS 123094]|uniref:DUF2231 domain-containing protein n=1 Tax=Amniculicola lignicola CBS 123094 TaxID=1392246 RepID=A0A6A5WKG7_9PLEO|nr:hypothetical protein P154DRAFT_463523 [Amniculicola lignicola CBS 123094]